MFKGEKKLLKLAKVKQIDVKRFDELNVKGLYDDFMTLPGVKDYFPDSYPKGRVCDRKFFFDTVNSLHPETIKQLVEHAITQRYSVKEDTQQQ